VENGVSQEKILKTLVSLGLTQWDAKVYILLAKRGPIKARDAAKALKISKQRLYPIIKSLQSKGIVNSTLERPARFSVVPFEKVLDSFLKAKIEQTQRIQQNKDGLLSDWQSITVAESTSSPAKFTVIEGRSYIYSKIQQMIQDTESHLSFVATVPSLARADQFGLFDAAFNHPLKSKIQFRFITELSEQNANALKALLKKKPKAGFNIEGKTPDLGLKLCPRMVIRDEEETVFFIDPRKGEFASEQDDVCLWTNCKSLVHAFLAMFEDLWRNATDIEKKIFEIETGKPTLKTHVISDAETAHNKYHEAMRSAKDEIIMMTSSKGLIACWKGIGLVREWTKRGVSIKIMAPITSENLEAAQQLLRCCEVRHVPTGYLGTTIVDGQHLFQFKNPPPEEEKLRAIPYFENTFYTNDFEYVKKTKNMLGDIWKNAHIPSSVTLESIIRPPAPQSATQDSVIPLLSKKIMKQKSNINLIIKDKKRLKTLTEKDVLNKFIYSQKEKAKIGTKDRIIMYASTGQAIIHPPEYFSLPDMLIQALHIDKKSSFGAEDALIISLWLATAKGHAYVPVAVVQDHPGTTEFWESWHKGFPAQQNIQLVKKDELQIRMHCNTLFAGWTVPIPLLPKPYSLPPSAILLEAYGNVKTGAFSYVTRSGYKVKGELNGFEAFVTLFHSSSKYTGPGTEGVLHRELIGEMCPP
jgi:sugar-specific transcriptional regulator TrmB